MTFLIHHSSYGCDSGRKFLLFSNFLHENSCPSSFCIWRQACTVYIWLLPQRVVFPGICEVTSPDLYHDLQELSFFLCTTVFIQNSCLFLYLQSCVPWFISRFAGQKLSFLMYNGSYEWLQKIYVWNLQKFSELWNWKYKCRSEDSNMKAEIKYLRYAA